MHTQKHCSFARITLTVLFCAAISAPRASAQVSAAISGTVTDASAAFVPAAAVTARNVETGAQRNTASDDAGRYQVLALPVGQYEVSVTKNGFQEIIRSGIHLAVGQQAIVDFSLQL